MNPRLPRDEESRSQVVRILSAFYVNDNGYRGEINQEKWDAYAALVAPFTQIGVRLVDLGCGNWHVLDDSSKRF